MFDPRHRVVDVAELLCFHPGPEPEPGADIRFDRIGNGDDEAEHT